MQDMNSWYTKAWGTKYRRKVFTDKVTQQEVEGLLREIALAYDMVIDRVEVLSDHVHMSVSAPPRFGWQDISSDQWVQD